MAEINPLCFICKNYEGSSKLLPLQDTSLQTAKNAAGRRKSLKKDQYDNITNEIISDTETQGRFYHSPCLSRFCAVKRSPPEVTQQLEPPTKIITRTRSTLPSTDSRGVLRQQCLFCGKARKKIKSENEPLHQCETLDGSRSIYLAAKRKNDTNILVLGEDLIAKGMQYHNSCRRDYVREETMEAAETSHRRKHHHEAFRKLSFFIKNEIIIKKKPMMGSLLLQLYQQEYMAAGGSAAQINEYNVQNLLKKIKRNFKDIQVYKYSNKTGAFVFPVSMTNEEAGAKIKNMSTKEEEIRTAAMILRTEILTIPPQQKPCPTFIPALKETAPTIPPLVQLFFDTLINGLQRRCNDQSELIDVRSTAMASDAMFNCTKGSLRPWKHEALGLGLATLTGSKSMLTILNRLGHSISYDEVKRLETEIGFSCSSGERETPSGLQLRPDLATGNNKKDVVIFIIL